MLDSNHARLDVLEMRRFRSFLAVWWLERFCEVGGSLGAPKSGSLRVPEGGSLGTPKSDIRDT